MIGPQSPRNPDIPDPEEDPQQERPERLPGDEDASDGPMRMPGENPDVETEL